MKAIHLTLDGTTAVCMQRGKSPAFAETAETVTCWRCRSELSRLRSGTNRFMSFVRFGLLSPATPHSRLALKLAKDRMISDSSKWWRSPLEIAHTDVEHLKEELAQAIDYENRVHNAIKALEAHVEEKETES